MTENVLPRLPTTKLLRVRLETACTKPVGLGSIPRIGAPPPDGQEDNRPHVDPPYVILYPLWVRLQGPVGSPEADSWWTYQTTLVARRTDQLEWLRDRVFAAMLGRSASTGKPLVDLDTDDVAIRDRELRDDTGMPTGETDPPLQSELRFGLFATPR